MIKYQHHAFGFTSSLGLDKNEIKSLQFQKLHKTFKRINIRQLKTK